MSGAARKAQDKYPNTTSILSPLDESEEKITDSGEYSAPQFFSPSSTEFPTPRPFGFYTPHAPESTDNPENITGSRTFESFYDPEAAQAAGWSNGYNDLQKQDTIMIKDYDEGMNALLVFAGLFSAIVTAFIIEVSGDLQEDPTETSAQLLLRITMQLQSTETNAGLPDLPVKSEPSATIIAIITLWYSSLAISIFTSLFAIYVKQWLRKYSEWEKEATHKRAIIIRGFYFQGLDDWHVSDIVACLPVLLQGSLVLFIIGLLAYLWTINKIIASILSAQMALFLLSTAVVTILPSFYPNCAYRTPFGYFWLSIATQLPRMLIKLLKLSGLKKETPDNGENEKGRIKEIVSKPRFFMPPDWKGRMSGPSPMVIEFTPRSAESTVSLASFLMGTSVTSLISVLKSPDFEGSRLAYRVKSLPEDLSRQLVRRIFFSIDEWAHRHDYSFAIMRLLGFLSTGEAFARWEVMLTLMSVVQKVMKSSSTPDILLDDPLYQEAAKYLRGCADSKKFPAAILQEDRKELALEFIDFALPLHDRNKNSANSVLPETTQQARNQVLYSYARVAAELFSFARIDTELRLETSNQYQPKHRAASTDSHRPRVSMYRRELRNSQRSRINDMKHVNEFFEEGRLIRSQAKHLQPSSNPWLPYSEAPRFPRSQMPTMLTFT